MGNLDKGMVVRTVFLLCALLNQFLTAYGYTPIDSEAVANFVAFVLTGVASAWSWWKNNSVTKEARKADEYMKELKKRK